jgi:hypothetical protein
MASAALTVDMQSPARAEKNARLKSIMVCSVQAVYTAEMRRETRLAETKKKKGSSKGGGGASIYGWTL